MCTTSGHQPVESDQELLDLDQKQRRSDHMAREYDHRRRKLSHQYVPQRVKSMTRDRKLESD